MKEIKCNYENLERGLIEQGYCSTETTVQDVDNIRIQDDYFVKYDDNGDLVSTKSIVSKFEINELKENDEDDLTLVEQHIEEVE